MRADSYGPLARRGTEKAASEGVLAVTMLTHDKVIGWVGNVRYCERPRHPPPPYSPFIGTGLLLLFLPPNARFARHTESQDVYHVFHAIMPIGSPYRITGRLPGADAKCQIP